MALLFKHEMVGGATAGPQLAVFMMETGVSRIFFFSRSMNRKLGAGYLPNKHLVKEGCQYSWMLLRGTEDEIRVKTDNVDLFKPLLFV